LITAGWPQRGGRGKKIQKYQKNNKKKERKKRDASNRMEMAPTKESMSGQFTTSQPLPSCILPTSLLFLV